MRADCYWKLNKSQILHSIGYPRATGCLIFLYFWSILIQGRYWCRMRLHAYISKCASLKFLCCYAAQLILMCKCMNVNDNVLKYPHLKIRPW
jgi:hypothetical protein